MPWTWPRPRALKNQAGSASRRARAGDQPVTAQRGSAHRAGRLARFRGSTRLSRSLCGSACDRQIGRRFSGFRIPYGWARSSWRSLFLRSYCEPCRCAARQKKNSTQMDRAERAGGGTGPRQQHTPPHGIAVGSRKRHAASACICAHLRPSAFDLPCFLAGPRSAGRRIRTAAAEANAPACNRPRDKRVFLPGNGGKISSSAGASG